MFSNESADAAHRRFEGAIERDGKCLVLFEGFRAGAHQELQRYGGHVVLTQNGQRSFYADSVGRRLRFTLETARAQAGNTIVGRVRVESTSLDGTDPAPLFTITFNPSSGFVTHLDDTEPENAIELNVPRFAAGVVATAFTKALGY